jgi:hypothetical protein
MSNEKQRRARSGASAPHNAAEAPEPIRDVAAWDAEVPDEIRKVLDLNAFIDRVTPDRVRHRVYRHKGDSSAFPKEIVGVIEDLLEAPDEHEIGTRFPRAGVYQVITEVLYRDEHGEATRVTRVLPVMRIGSEYEDRAAAGAPVPAAVPDARAPTAASPDFFSLFDRFVDATVKLRGPVADAVPPDVAAMQRSMKFIQDEADRQMTRLRDQVEDAERRARRVERDAAPPSDGGAGPVANLEKMGEAAGSVLKVIKGAVDLFGSGGADAAGAAAGADAAP